MPTIRISDENYDRLKAYAEPLVDTCDTALSKMFDLADKNSSIPKYRCQLNEIGLPETSESALRTVLYKILLPENILPNQAGRLVQTTDIRSAILAELDGLYVGDEMLPMKHLPEVELADYRWWERVVEIYHELALVGKTVPSTCGPLGAPWWGLTISGIKWGGIDGNTAIHLRVQSGEV